MKEPYRTYTNMETNEYFSCKFKFFFNEFEDLSILELLRMFIKAISLSIDL
jgi:hypothetical protein